MKSFKSSNDHLLKKQIKNAGLKAKANLSLSDDAVRDLIRYYTREAGVRKSGT
jgi:ATP-dependent Lon protease